MRAPKECMRGPKSERQEWKNVEKNKGNQTEVAWYVYPEFLVLLFARIEGGKFHCNGTAFFGK